MPDQSINAISALRELPSACVEFGDETGVDMDITLLRISLAMTPWERMLANDDAQNFAESLRAAMKKRNAKFK